MPRVTAMTIQQCAEQLAPIYAAEQWEWITARTPHMHVPPAQEIAAMIDGLLVGARMTDRAHHCGGLTVERSGDGWRVTMTSKSHGAIVCEVGEKP